MSYFRGAIYVWCSEAHTHFWSTTGADGWEESVWAAGQPEPPARESGPSGVSIPQPVVDEFVVMRFAQMLDERLVRQAVDRALVSASGNFGVDSLRTHADRLRGIAPEEQSPEEQSPEEQSPEEQSPS